MFEVYKDYSGYEIHEGYFDNLADAEEYCLTCAEYACFERYCLSGYNGIIWNGPNTLSNMGQNYRIREVKQ